MFYSERTYKLDDFGWKDCSITFKALSWAEMMQLDKLKAQMVKEPSADSANKVVDLLQKQFVKGTALDENKEKVELTSKTLENIPFDIFLKLIDFLLYGGVDPGLKDNLNNLSSTEAPLPPN